MKSIIVRLTILGLFLTGQVVVAQPQQMRSGWYWPTGSSSVGGYLGWLDYNNDTYPWHLGDDMSNSVGSPVYAIGAGTVLESRTNVGGYGPNFSQGGALYARHQAADGTWFTATYGHLTSPHATGKIDAGEILGYTNAFSPSHLHFAVHPGYDPEPTNPWRGYTSSKSNTYGFTDPLPFLDAHPAVSVTSFFDGAGSLVRPSENCWGCNKDEADMHPHADKPSTVVFQWKNDATSCSHVDVSTVPDIGVLAVRARSWDSHLMSAAFASKPPVSVPSQGSWTIFSVTSEKPLTSKVSVTAYCKSSSTTQVGNPQSFTKDLVGFDFDYFWSGNGSLISSSTQPGYGATKDDAVTYSSNKSLTIFQWYRSNSCTKVKVSDSSGANVSLLGGGVSMKEWNAPEFEANLCSQLPCTVDKPTNGYYLIKIKSAAGALPSGVLSAVCTN